MQQLITFIISLEVRDQLIKQQGLRTKAFPALFYIFAHAWLKLLYFPPDMLYLVAKAGKNFFKFNFLPQYTAILTAALQALSPAEVTVR
jgi:hypothetical protein